MTNSQQTIPHVVVIGAGIGGLTTAALLAQDGYQVTVLEAQTYPGGCASTYYYQGYRFESGATLAGGFQTNGPHYLLGQRLGLKWPIHRSDPAWVVHLPDREIVLQSDYADIIRQFPQSAGFWEQQETIAAQGWHLAAQGLPWPPTNLAEGWQLVKIGAKNFPTDLGLIPFALGTVERWLKRHQLADDIAFRRFIDGQLLISAQSTAKNVNALYGATALDLARQGVYHVEGGIGGLAYTLVDKLKELGGEILYRHQVTGIEVEGNRVIGVKASKSKHDKKGQFFPCDFVVGNVTPWSLDELLGDDSPSRLRKEVVERGFGWGAFVLHLGVEADRLSDGIAEHHQIITEMEGPLGEGRSLFVSMSPIWDQGRAPQGKRAVTITTHTAVQQWWDLLARDPEAYGAKKETYTERILEAVNQSIPRFKESIVLNMAGSPVTYNTFTGRHKGTVGGFPQVSLLKARGPRTGLSNLRLVGDSIFPGQSTAGVTLGGMRVAADVKRVLPMPRKICQTHVREISRP
jgi:C-3',4' desaturase CrtD